MLWVQYKFSSVNSICVIYCIQFVISIFPLILLLFLVTFVLRQDVAELKQQTLKYTLFVDKM